MDCHFSFITSSHALPEIKIKPPSLTPPSKSNPQLISAVNHWWIVLILVIITAVLLSVVVYLPHWVEDNNIKTVATEQIVSNPVNKAPAIVPETETGAAKLDEQRQVATMALQAYLRMRSKPELANAQIWGGMQWQQAENDAGQAEIELRKQRFTQAGEYYTSATSKLESLITNRSSLFDDYLEKATLALSNQRVDESISWYQKALSIKPDEQNAINGLARAKKRTQLLKLIASGENAQLEERLDDALELYQQAITLDDKFAGPAQKIQQLRSLIVERDFNKLIASANQAFDKNDLTTARANVNQAKKLLPKNPKLIALDKRLTAEEVNLKIRLLKQKAAQLMKIESWQQAQVTYFQILKLEPNSAFAIKGRSLALQNLKLMQSLDQYLNHPSRLTTPKVLKKAQALLSSSINPSADYEPVLADKMDKLNALVANAMTPLSVILKSDENTDIVIYPVGSVGRFKQKTVSLRPGEYNAVGSRAGYRDVRIKFFVSVDKRPGEISIICREKL